MLQPELHRHALAPRTTVFPFALMTLLLLLAGVSQPAESQTYRVIYNFTGNGSDGATPYGGPTLDRSGNLYGTTYLGGTYGSGTVYRLSPRGSSWTYSSLYSFKGVSDGAGPAFGSLVIGGNRALFGTTEAGGNFGTAFAVCNCPGREIVLHRFGTGTDGAQPIGGVVLDAAGNLYGTTSFGGANGSGVVYQLSRSGSTWKQTVLYNFQGIDDGQNPVGGVVLDPAGNLYGTTFDGGINGGGTVYQLSPSGDDWIFTTLYSFSGGYGGPYNKLTLDSKGNIYGFTNGDGAFGLGSVFKLTPANGGWTFTDLYDFTGGSQGASPYGSVAVDADGNVFGTAAVGGSQNQGLVFEIIP